MKWFLVFFAWILMLHEQFKLTFAKQAVSIGIFLDSSDTQVELPLYSTLSRNNLDKKNPVIVSENVKRIRHNDIFNTAEAFCTMLSNEGGLQAAIANFEISYSTPLLESASKNYHIPLLTTSWRAYASTDSDYFINFYPEGGLLARAMAEIIKSLHWKSYILFYETEEELIQLQEVLKLQSPVFMKVVQLGEGSDHRTILKSNRNSTETNIILACATELIIPILMQAREVGMLNVNYNYFLTSLDAHTLDYSILNTTTNITTIRLFDPNSDSFQNTVYMWSLTEFDYSNKIEYVAPNSIKTQTALFYDSLLYLTDALNTLTSYSRITNQILSCNTSDTFQNGFAISSAIKSVKYAEGLTSPIKLDSDGNRVDFNIYVYEVIDEALIATWFQRNETIVLARTGNETDTASISNLKKITVIVATKLGEPYLREVPPSENGTELEGNDRYEGYSKDLLDAIADKIGFKYEFKVGSGYGKWDDQKKKWTGLFGDLLEKRAQLAICDLTITKERSEVVDFSMPFMTLGISILHKLPHGEETDMFAFLKPFATAVWIYSATLYLVISLMLFFIARMTPGDWENPNPSDENPEELENIWTLKNCHWVTLASIMNQGSDILPKGISSRLAVSMWWFFALIITNSYIANLTAFLTKAGLESPIASVEALAKQSKIRYGLLEGGSTDTFFRTSNLSMYQRMYSNMKRWRPSVFEKENKDGVARVRNDNNALYAFLMESTQIEYEIEKDCKLKQVGNWLDTKSYGIAMPLNAAYRPAINKAVLYLQETGKLSDLKLKWWKNPNKEASCSTNKATPEGEGLHFSNVGGIFLVLGSGIGVALIFGFLVFLWNVRDVSVEEHLSYWETLKLELKFACNVFITKKKIKPAAKDSLSSSEKGSEKGDNKNGDKNLANSTFYLNKI